MKVDYKTINGFRAPLHELNKVWCPDEKIRLKMFIEEHFVERLLDRFEPRNAADLVKQIWKWIDQNYCTLLFDSRVRDNATKYRINFNNGTVCFVLFDNTLRIRTCFTGHEYE